ncbi:tetratricopeptide repeat protein [Lactobacillus corticis]|uniref:TPR repeat-containing protein n=1 Tax=Lactobacillus corticis TaxID=2201249 RepID=A0A916QI02_9LACO|nr:tetratricopeptide repeat protein [Lactobacillus corticis]GFZ27755.1 TPR repeat-containing protein [Lactobacillus corticis]
MNEEISELYNQGKVAQAIHKLVAAIDQHPQQAENYLQLATYLIEQGDPASATELLEKGQGQVADPQALSYDLAICYYLEGKFDQAMGLLNALPNDDLTLYQKSLVYLKLGQTSKALAYALTIKKVDNRVRELLGDIWLALGDLKQADKILQTIPPEARSSKVNFLLGVVNLDRDREASLSYFAKAKKLDPKYYDRAKNQYGSIMQMLSKKKDTNDD